jgi:hypothetical protein
VVCRIAPTVRFPLPRNCREYGVRLHHNDCHTFASRSEAATAKIAASTERTISLTMIMLRYHRRGDRIESLPM